MMKCCVSHMTAVRWFMAHENPRARVGYRQRPIDLSCCSAVPEDRAEPLARALEIPDGAPIDLIVGRARDRRGSDRVRYRTCAFAPLPAGSLVRLPVEVPQLEVYAACPEWAFAQICGEGDLIGSIYTGHALCSGYRMDATCGSGVRSRADGALTSVFLIERYLQEADGIWGGGRAREALPFVMEGSRSPMETGLGMWFGLPVRLGGFGLNVISLNPRVRIPSVIGSVGERFPDIAIAEPGLRLGARVRGRSHPIALVDYDADSEHATSRRKVARDSGRRNELATVRDVVHFTVTTDQVGDYLYMCKLAEGIRKTVGARRLPRFKPGTPEDERHARLDEIDRLRFALWFRLIGKKVARRSEP